MLKPNDLYHPSVGRYLEVDLWPLMYFRVDFFMVQAVKDIFGQLRRVRDKGSFAQNVTIVFSGNVLNLLLQLVFAPIISRIYGPEAYGEYAYYNLIISNIGFFAAMSLPSVYVLPKTRYEYLALAKVVVFSVIGISLLSLVVFLVFNGIFFDFKGSYFAIPIVFALIVLANLNNVFGSWNAREKRFRRNTSVGVFGNMLAKSGTLGIGYFFLPYGIGLLSADLIKSIFTFFSQTSWKLRLVVLRYLAANNWRYVVDSFRKNLNVPKYIFPSQLLNKWTADLPILIIGAYYSKEMLGLFVFAVTMLNIPKHVISNAIQPVYYQKANSLFQTKRESLADFVSSTFTFSLILLIGPLIVFIVWAPSLFSFAFGEEWKEAGVIASVVGFQYFLETLIAPLGGIRRIMGFEKKILLLTIVSIGLRSIPLLLLFWQVEFLEFLLIYAGFVSVGLLLNVTDLFFTILDKRRAVSLTLFLVFIFGSVVFLTKVLQNV